MRVKKVTLPAPMGKRGETNPLKIVLFGDVHLGNKLFARKAFEKQVIGRYKGRPNTWFIDMSDGCDMIVANSKDPRFDASMVEEAYTTVKDPVDRQIADYAKLIEPIKDQILCMLDGNHHQTISNKCGTDPTRRIAYALFPEKEYPGKAESIIMGYSGFLVVRLHGSSGGTFPLTFNLCHGIGTGGKTEGGFITSIGNDAVNYDADVHAYGHNHRLQGWDRIKIGVSSWGEKVISRKEIRLATGTYLKAFSDDANTSYSERARFKPNELGHMELDIVPYRVKGKEERGVLLDYKKVSYL